MNGDSIKSLPVDSLPPTPDEMVVLHSVFNKENSSSVNKLWSGLKDVILTSLLFALVSSPLADTYISKLNMHPLFAKTLIFALLFFLLQNYHLSRS